MNRFVRCIIRKRKNQCHRVSFETDIRNIATSKVHYVLPVSSCEGTTRLNICRAVIASSSMMNVSLHRLYLSHSQLDPSHIYMYTYDTWVTDITRGETDTPLDFLHPISALDQPFSSRLRPARKRFTLVHSEKRVQAGVKTTPDRLSHRTKRFRVYHPVHPLLASMPLTLSSSSGHCYNRVHQCPRPYSAIRSFSLFFLFETSCENFDTYFQKSVPFIVLFI